MFAHITDVPLARHVELEFSKQNYLQAIEKLQKFSNIVHLGTGGSSLGPQSLYAMVDVPEKAFIFMDNIDPCGIYQRLKNVDLTKSGVLAVSKSGNTAETLVQLATIKKLYEANGLDINDYLVVITQTDGNALHTFAKQNNVIVVPHHNQIGGRFAVFAEVGELPGILMGIDMQQFRSGAKAAIDSLKKEKDNYQSIQAAQYLAESKLNPVVFPYSDKLKLFSAWFAQLWGESLGKKNQQGKRFGSTPLQALGATDQHSQLQLYIDGPKDKFFTFLEVTEHKNYDVADLAIDHPSYNPLRGHSLAKLLKAELDATFTTLKKHELPLRLITIPKVDTYHLGQLMMNAVIETLHVAKIWDINPFDQPAVEEGKILALQFLNG